ncbi:MAG: RHS repeat-associated core domain-containing protein [Bacteroidota bacterium]
MKLTRPLLRFNKASVWITLMCSLIAFVHTSEALTPSGSSFDFVVSIDEINASNPASEPRKPTRRVAHNGTKENHKTLKLNLSSTEEGAGNQVIYTHILLADNNTAPITQSIDLTWYRQQNVDCAPNVDAIVIKGKLDLGDRYEWGETVDFQVEAAFNMVGIDRLGNQIFNRPVRLSIDKHRPEQLYLERFKGDYNNLERVDIIPNSNKYMYSNLVNEEAVRFTFSVDQELSLDVSSVKLSLESPAHTELLTESWEHSFTWRLRGDQQCEAIPNYEFQMVRQYDIMGTPMWDKALKIYTNSGERNLKVTIAEGSGEYYWRVRAIGAREDGFSGQKGWVGDNSDSGPWANGYFRFTNPDDEKNWNYSRSFTEGNKVSEQLTIANGLQHVNQQQTRINDRVVVVETIQDFAGRDALNSLPVPMLGNDNKLGYKYGVLENASTLDRYGTEDFDTDPKNAYEAESFVGYYTGAEVVENIDGELTILNEGVASAEGYPYTRMLFTADGTGRVREEAGVGVIHKIGGGRSMRTFYSGVSESEMLMLYGEAAPYAANVHKIIAFDANNTGTIHFQDKDGDILATALSMGTEDGPLLPLEFGRDPKRIFEVVPGTEQVDDFLMNVKKPLFFTSATMIDFTYEITPNVIQSFCNTGCRSCDYRVEVYLHEVNEGSDTPLSSTLLGSDIIDMAALCGARTPYEITLDSYVADPLVHYVLEKRIYANTEIGASGVTHLQDYILTESNAYQDGVDVALNDIMTFLDEEDIQGLYDYLASNYTYDIEQQGYEVPLNCGGVIYVPTPDICEGELPSMNGGICLLYDPNEEDGGTYYTFVEYFDRYWEGKYEAADALFFEDRFDQVDLSFAEGEFDQMITNLLNENPVDGNGDIIDCERLWEIWKLEVSNYENWLLAEGDPDFTGGLDSENRPTADVVFKYSLFQRFMNSIDGALTEDRKLDATDICELDQNNQRTFFRGYQIYGRIGQSIVEPDLNKAHLMVYYDENDEGLRRNFNRILGNLNPDGSVDNTIRPSSLDFYNLPDCDKFRMAKSGLGFDTDPQWSKEELLVETEDKCKEACALRSEAFKQAIIDDLFNTDPNTIIQHYVVSYVVTYRENEDLMDEEVLVYTGRRDGAENTTVYDISECELDAMVDALVVNCSGYCDLDFYVDLATQLEQLGTPEQIDAIQKVFTYGFDVNVRQDGEVCTEGWDDVPGRLESSAGWNKAHTLFSYYLAGLNVQPIVGGGYYLYGLVDFDLDFLDGSVITSNSNSDLRDFLIVKVDANDEFEWKRHFEVTINTESNSVNIPSEITTSDISSGNETDLLNFQVLSSGDLIFIHDPTYAFASADVKIYLDGVLIQTLKSDEPRYMGRIDSQGTLLWTQVSESTYGFIPFISQDNHIYNVKSLDASEIQVVKRDENGVLIGDYLGDIVKVTTANGGRPGGAFGNYKLHKLGQHFVVELLLNTIENYEIYVNNVLLETVNTARISSTALILFDEQGKYLNNLFFIGDNGLATFSQSGRALPPFVNESGLHMNFFNNAKGDIRQDITITSSDGELSNTIIDDQMLFVLIDENLSIIDQYKYDLKELPGLDDFDFENNGQLSFGVKHNGYNPIYAIRDYSDNGWYFVETNVEGREVDVTSVPVQSRPPQAEGFFRRDNCYDIFAYSINPPLLLDQFELNSFPRSTVFGRYCESAASCSSYSQCFRWTSEFDFNLEGEAYDPKPKDCETITADAIRAEVEGQRADVINSFESQLETTYKETCANADNIVDKLTLDYELGLHHFTLYYYDRAGNLMRTVPPAGVNLLDVSTEAMVEAARTTETAHDLITHYEYNSLGQLSRQETPDAGITEFIYDDIGQSRFSQNAQQLKDSTYSYTKYDKLGRVTEVGLADLSGISDVYGLNTYANDPDYPAWGREVTITKYSTPSDLALPDGLVQRNLINRVSYSYTDEDGVDDPDIDDRTTTIYSYDVHGNMEWLVQKLPGIEDPFLIKYSYDLLSGNVNTVSFNPNKPDRFFHKYEYDADNRIEVVYTSRDGYLWDKDASYEYYAHGPLKRRLIGEDAIQGIDYTYTIHGWLKAINQQDLIIDTDPGRDGFLDAVTAADAFAMTLNYYAGDYDNASRYLGQALNAKDDRNLYNGNISSWSTNAQPIPGVNYAYNGLNGRQFVYDELNRIKSSHFNREGVGAAAWMDNGTFYSGYDYDPNGNLQSLNRFTNEQVDQLTYEYYEHKNQLKRVRDAIADDVFFGDLDDQRNDQVVDIEVDGETTNNVNYEYDAIGNLIRDHSQNSIINWTAYGKVKDVEVDGKRTKFSYNATGNRVSKIWIKEDGTVVTDYYIRDASGNTMAVYRQSKPEGTDSELILKEVSLYGSDRLGVYRPQMRIEGDKGLFPEGIEIGEHLISQTEQVDTYEGRDFVLEDGAMLNFIPGFSFEAANADTEGLTVRMRQYRSVENEPNLYTRLIDKKSYELKDHLGNIRAVVTDRKLADVSSGTPLNFKAKVLEQMDYYPFGMVVPNTVPAADVSLATLESSRELEERATFGSSYDNGSIIPAQLYNYTQTFEADRSQRLTGLEGEAIGLARSLEVKPGDTIKMEVYAKYLPVEPDPDAAPLVIMLAPALTQSLISSGVDVTAEVQQTFEDLFSTGSIINDGDDHTPRAYLNYLFFDENLALVDAGFRRVSALAEEEGSDIVHEKLELAFLPDRKGTLYTYLSNESTNVTEVFFDDYRIIHATSTAIMPDIAYRYGFNGKERDDSFGLTSYDYGFRIYNPALGKFLSVDPLTKSYPMLTPYQFASNRPIDGIDLDGLEHKRYYITLDDGGTQIKKREGWFRRPGKRGWGTSNVYLNESGEELYRTFESEKAPWVWGGSNRALWIRGKKVLDAEGDPESPWEEFSTTAGAALTIKDFEIQAEYSLSSRSETEIRPEANYYLTYDIVGGQIGGKSLLFDVSLPSAKVFISADFKFREENVIEYGSNFGVRFKQYFAEYEPGRSFRIGAGISTPRNLSSLFKKRKFSISYKFQVKVNVTETVNLIKSGDTEAGLKELEKISDQVKADVEKYINEVFGEDKE